TQPPAAGRSGPAGLPRLRKRDRTPPVAVRPATRGGPAAAASERLQRRLLFLLDVEQLVQLRDLEDLVDLRVNVAQDQPAAHRVDLLVERDELAQGGAGEVLDVAEVQQQLAPAQLVHEAEELFTDD